MKRRNFLQTAAAAGLSACIPFASAGKYDYLKNFPVDVETTINTSARFNHVVILLNEKTNNENIFIKSNGHEYFFPKCDKPFTFEHNLNFMKHVDKFQKGPEIYIFWIGCLFSSHDKGFIINRGMADDRHVEYTNFEIYDKKDFKIVFDDVETSKYFYRTNDYQDVSFLPFLTPEIRMYNPTNTIIQKSATSKISPIEYVK